MIAEAPHRTTVRFPRLYPKQAAFAFDPARYTVCFASTKSGKSVALLVWMLSRAFDLGGPGRNFHWIAPSYPVAKEMYLRVQRWLSKADSTRSYWDSNDSELFISVINGSRIYFKGGERPDLLYGPDSWGVVIDEASRVREEVWHAARSIVTKTEAPIKIIGNMRGRRNWMYRLWEKGRQDPESGISSHILTAMDAVQAGVLSDREIEDARAQLPEHIFRELYMAEPTDDGSNPFGLDHIRACMTPKSAKPTVAFGVDLGLEVDYSVVIGLDEDARVCHFGRWQHVPWPITEAHIAQKIENTHALIDATGLGSPVFQHLQGRCPQLEPFVFTGRSKQELIDSLIIAIQQGQIGYPDGQIVSELETMEATFTRTGVQYQAMSGMHDDCVMALALAWRMWLARPREQSVVETWEV